MRSVVFLAVISAALVRVSHADTLSDQAQTCSDEAVRLYAVSTCEPIDQVVMMAFENCRPAWNKAISALVGPAPVNPTLDQTKDFLSKMRIYDETAKDFYTSRRKTDAMDLRARAGVCGPR
jgi:hypothetical protein